MLLIFYLGSAVRGLFAMRLVRLFRHACLSFFTIIFLAAPDGASADNQQEITQLAMEWAAKRKLDSTRLYGAFNDELRDRFRRYYWMIGNTDEATSEAGKMTTLAPWRTRNWLLYGIAPQYFDDCRRLEAFEAHLQQCLMNRECGERRQQEIALSTYNMKQPCT